MKVKELIDLLQEYDPEADVLVDWRAVEITADDSGYGSTPTLNLST